MYRLTLEKLRILSATKTFDRADVQTEMKEFKARVLMSTDESVRLQQPLSIKVWTDLSETLCACQQMFPLPRYSLHNRCWALLNQCSEFRPQ